MERLVSAHLLDQWKTEVRVLMKEPYYNTRLIIRTTEELKGAYLGLCRSKGVTASDEVRAFMARELQKAAQDTYRGKPPTNAAKWKTEGQQEKKSKKR